jgi:hypothetical protein
MLRISLSADYLTGRKHWSCSISLKNFQVQQKVCRETVDMKTMAEEVNHRIMVMALIM